MLASWRACYYVLGAFPFPEEPLKHPILKKRTPGGESAARASFTVAINHPWEFDAYIVQYTGDKRLNKEHVAAEPMNMVVELYDFDTPGHAAVTDHVDWVIGALERLPPGFQGCATAGGFRVWTERAEPFVIKDGETWEEWRAYHAGRAEALGKAIGAEPDHATDDPGRLFRLPNVQREDGKPCYPDLIGELGVATLEPLPWARRAATSASSGAAALTMLGECFEALGWVRQDGHEKLTVRCPWAHEHSKGGDDLAVVYATEDGVGKFHCGHTHCDGRHSDAAIEAIKGNPAVAEVLDRWLYKEEADEGPSFSEPSPLVTDSEPEAQNPKPEPRKDLPWVTGAALAEPVGPVRWLIPALEIAPGRTPMIAADSGAGKSWSVQSIALSVATGMPVFGEFECRKGPVLHIAEDSDIDAVRDRYQRLARGMGLSLAELDLAVYGRRFSMTDSKGNFQLEALKPIQMAITSAKAVLVIVDSLATTCVGLDENGPEIAQPLYATRDREVTWLWTHHTNKSGESYRGSSALKAACGAMWAVTKEGEDGPRVWENVKHAERTETKNRLAGFATAWDGQRISVVKSAEASKAGSERACDRAQHAMLRLLEAQGKADKAALMRAAGGTTGRTGAVNRAVFDFLANPLGGQITQVERGKFVLAAGVVVPKQAHDLKVTLPDSVIKELNAVGRKSAR